MPPRTASSSSKKSGKARASSAELREAAIANALAAIAQEPVGDTDVFVEYALTAVQALDTLESLGADKQLIREQEQRAAEFLGDYVSTNADEDEFRHPRLIRGSLRHDAVVHRYIEKSMREDAAKRAEAAAKAEEAAAKPESSSSAGKPARRSVRLHVPEPVIELDDDDDENEPSAKPAAVTGKRKTRSSGAKTDASPGESSSAPRAKKAKPGELPVFSAPTYTGKSAPRLPPSGQRCDYCAAYSTKVKCIVRAGLDSCDRCALQFHSCKGTKASNGDTERYTDWYDANGFDRADRPDAAEVRKVFHDRQRPAAVPLWAREGGSGGAAPSSSSARVPSTSSRPSALRKASSASASRKVEVVVPPAPAKPRDSSPLPIKREDDDVEMIDDSPPRTPPPRSPSPPSSAPSAPRPARPSQRPPPPADSPSNPVGRKVSSSSAAAASSSQAAPGLGLASVNIASLVHVAPVDRARYRAISAQMDILESQRWVIDQQLEQLRHMRDQLVEGGDPEAAEDDEDAEGEEDEEAGPSA
ncbi:hypothetical protein OH77DRAFT_1525763 [Trametes cingulata]|nr:hypothetical protein OH77DRAFT_1525763 [Trametes cingulata]